MRQKTKAVNYHIITDRLTNEEEDHLNYFLKNFEVYLIQKEAKTS